MKFQKDIVEVAQSSLKELHKKYCSKQSSKVPTELATGSYVLVKSDKATKIDQKWNGPFRVVNQDAKSKSRLTVQSLVTGKLEDFFIKSL
jgi:hypothetical protein